MLLELLQKHLHIFDKKTMKLFIILQVLVFVVSIDNENKTLFQKQPKYFTMHTKNNL